MQKTTIEYCDYTWNPVTGCYGPGGTKEQPRYCPYCYAKRIAERFRGTKAFPNGFEPTFHMDRITAPWSIRKRSRIFVCSMADMFGDWVAKREIERILRTVRECEYQTFIFLTKNPKRLAEFNPWPENAWVGATATDHPMYDGAITDLSNVRATVRFISCEPLLSPISAYELSGNVDWLILGAKTNPLRLPQRGWVDDIEQHADKWNIPVFEKNSLASLFPERKLRQEWPG